MDNVYDYMFHLLSECAKLLRYRPPVPDGAVEVTVRSMTRGRRGLEREFMVGTAVNVSGSAEPCQLPSPFGSEELEALRRRKAGGDVGGAVTDRRQLMNEGEKSQRMT